MCLPGGALAREGQIPLCRVDHPRPPARFGRALAGAGDGEGVAEVAVGYRDATAVSRVDGHPLTAPRSRYARA